MTIELDEQLATGHNFTVMPQISAQERWERDQAEALRLAPTLDPRWRAARQQQRQGEQQATINELHANIAPALREAVLAAQELHQKRAANLEAARKALADHQAGQPSSDNREAIGSFARQTGQLRDELAEYERFMQQAEAQLNTAHATAREAVEAQRLGEMGTIRTETQQGRAELEADLAEYDRLKQARIDVFNETFQPKAARYHLLEHLWNW